MGISWLMDSTCYIFKSTFLPQWRMISVTRSFSCAYDSIANLLPSPRFDFCSLWTLTSSPHLTLTPETISPLTYLLVSVCSCSLVYLNRMITPQNLTYINQPEYTCRSAWVLNIIWIKPRTRCIGNVRFSGRVSGLLVGEDQWRHLMCSFNTVQIHTLGAKHVQTRYHRQTTRAAYVKRAKTTHAVRFSVLALLNMQKPALSAQVCRMQGRGDANSII